MLTLSASGPTVMYASQSYRHVVTCGCLRGSSVGSAQSLAALTVTLRSSTPYASAPARNALEIPAIELRP